MVRKGSLTIWGYNFASGLPSCKEIEVRLYAKKAKGVIARLTSRRPVRVSRTPAGLGSGSKIKVFALNNVDETGLETAGKRICVQDLALFPLGVAFDGKVLWSSERMPPVCQATVSILQKWMAAFPF